MVLSGILSLVFGALPMLAPAAGALAMVLWIGASAARVRRRLTLALAFRVRSAVPDRVEPHRKAA